MTPPLNLERSKKIIDRFARCNLLVLGDLMMDRFIWGNVSRISPEAPVPVVQVSREEDRPGGAGNVIFNLVALDAKVYASGIVGMDSAGEKLVRDFEYRGINVEGILLDPSRPTSLKSRVIAGQQHIVRFDRESSAPIAAEFERRLLDILEPVLNNVHAVILSDYGKGLITPGLVSWLSAKCRKMGLMIFVDPKPDNMKLYKNVTCVTPNALEAFLGMGQLPRMEDEDVEAVGAKIVSLLKLQELIITRGARGMTLFEPNSHRARASSVIHIPTMAREVFDVTGAGDTVIATYALARTAGAKPAECALLANAAAGIVVGKVGTATVTRTELLAAADRLAAHKKGEE